MSECQSCSQLPKLHSSGCLILYSKDHFLKQKIRTNVVKRMADVSEGEQVTNINYYSFEQLDHLLEQLALEFSKREMTQILGSYRSHETRAERFPNMVSFDKLYERLKHRQYLTIINEGIFTQHMQPIVALRDNQIFGYEFLLRQVSDAYPFFPGELFSFSQRAGLQSSLDSQARRSSIEVSAKQLKSGVKRFINFLPSSIYDPNHCLKSTFETAERHSIDPSDLVFEVVETEQIDDIDHLKNIFHTYQKHGIKVALDDLGSGFSTLDVLCELKPDFVKIDRELIDHCDQDKEKQSKIAAIVKVGNEYGMTLLAEGIERREEADYCQSIGISLAQGYYFGKPQQSPVESDAVVG